jgi:hypothetical protein
MNTIILKEDLIRRELIWIFLSVVVVATIAAAVSWQAGLWGLFLLTAGWWAWQNPTGAVMFLLVLMPVLPSFKITQTVGTFTLVKDVLIIVLFAKQFLKPLWQQTLPYRRNILWWPIVTLGAWTLVSLWGAPSLPLGILRAREIGLYALFYFVVLYLPWSRNLKRELMFWGLTAAGMVIILSIYQWWGARDSAVLRFDPVRNVWIPRISSVMAHPSILGEYLVAIETLVVALAVSLKNKWRWWVWGSSVALLVPIYLTYSRAVWMGLVAALGVMGLAYGWRLVKQKVSKRVLFRGVLSGSLVMLLVMTFVFWFTNASVFVRSIFDPTYGSNEERIEFMVRLISPITNTQALFGAGLGDVLTQNFRETDLSGFQIASGASRAVQLAKNNTLVDNQYLKTFVEMGLVGVLIYFWIYLTLAKYLTRLVVKGVGSKVVIGLWGLGFLAAFMVQALFIDVWDIFPTNLLFWLVAAMASVEILDFDT